MQGLIPESWMLFFYSFFFIISFQPPLYFFLSFLLSLSKLKNDMADKMSLPSWRTTLLSFRRKVWVISCFEFQIFLTFLESSLYLFLQVSFFCFLFTKSQAANCFAFHIKMLENRSGLPNNSSQFIEFKEPLQWNILISRTDQFWPSKNVFAVIFLISPTVLSQ